MKRRGDKEEEEDERERFADYRYNQFSDAEPQDARDAEAGGVSLNGGARIDSRTSSFPNNDTPHCDSRRQL